MPFESYVASPSRKQVKKDRFHNGSGDGFFWEDSTLSRVYVFDHAATIDRWKEFEEIPRLKRISGSGWFVYRGKSFEEEEHGPNLVGILKDRMKISGKDAEILVEGLFKELDQIARERNAEPFSQNEKEQLILAITKTARNIVKEAFKK